MTACRGDVWADADVRSMGAQVCRLPVVDWIWCGIYIPASPFFSPFWSHSSELELCDCWTPGWRNREAKSLNRWEWSHNNTAYVLYKNVYAQRFGSSAESGFFTAKLCHFTSLSGNKYPLESDKAQIKAVNSYQVTICILLITAFSLPFSWPAHTTTKQHRIRLKTERLAYICSYIVYICLMHELSSSMASMVWTRTKKHVSTLINHWLVSSTLISHTLETRAI